MSGPPATPSVDIRFATLNSRLRHADADRGAGLADLLFVITGLYTVSVFAMARLGYRGAPRDRPAQSPLADIAEGFRYRRDDRIIPGLLVMGIVPMTFGFTATFFLPAYNKDILHGGPQALGLLMTAMGVGALGGSFLLARLGDMGGKGRLMFLSCYGSVP